MICLEFSSSKTSVAEKTSATHLQKDQKESPNPPPYGFSDSHYLRQVIRLLRNERKRKGMGVEELAARAKLREGVISRAEKESVIPTCREFRAWAKSLGISWEQLWTQAFPLALADIN